MTCSTNPVIIIIIIDQHRLTRQAVTSSCLMLVKKQFTVTKSTFNGDASTGGQKVYTIMRLGHDKTWKFETEPIEDIR